MTEEIRPICLYVETCLDKKEGTRDCAKCEHHLSYWTEVMMRDMEKNVTRLEQENKTLKNSLKDFQYSDEQHLLKVIELEQENKELKAYKDINEDFKKAWDELNKKYTEVLKLAKENADSNEYCLQELEQENEELKEENIEYDEELAIEKLSHNSDLETLERYRSALEEIREIEELAYYSKGMPEEPLLNQRDFILHAINDYEQRRIKILTKINEVLNESK